VRSFPWLVASACLALAASQASAQCYYIAPPTAPDMRNPGYYYQNCYGVIYGPNYWVRPPFPPYQGVIPGPPKQQQGPHPMAQYAKNPEEFQKAMEMYYKQQSFGGFPRHLWARSPRDYFMYDVGPAPSPYNYGAAADTSAGSGSAFFGSASYSGTSSYREEGPRERP